MCAFGFLESAGGASAIPRELGARISADTAKAVGMADVRDRMVSQGIDPVGSTPDVHLARVKAEFGRIGRIVKEAGIRGD